MCGRPEKHENCLYSKKQVLAALEQITLVGKTKQSNPYNLNDLTFSVIGKKKNQAYTINYVR